MATLRNEILKVKELKRRYVTEQHQLIQCKTPSKNTIEKTQIKKLGFLKVTGMLLQDVKNPYFEIEKVGTIHPLTGMEYNETEYITETTWLFE